MDQAFISLLGLVSGPARLFFLNPIIYIVKIGLLNDHNEHIIKKSTLNFIYDNVYEGYKKPKASPTFCRKTISLSLSIYIYIYTVKICYDLQTLKNYIIILGYAQASKPKSF